jgi:endonuclease/exonuclease/phosphatase family metal-dependent hydrolase
MPKLLVYNIAYGQGLQGSKQGYLKFWRRLFPPKKTALQLIESISQQKPDILSLVELDTGKQQKILQSKLNYKYTCSHPKYSFQGLQKIFKYIPLLRKQGNGLFSQYEIQTTYHMLANGMKRLVIETTLFCPQQITIFTVHLSLRRKTRALQLLQLQKIIATKTNPIIITGDFNATPDELKHFLQQTQTIDISPNAYTFPTYRPRKKIDYILASPSIKPIKSEVLNWHFSDHKPLFVEFIV